MMYCGWFFAVISGLLLPAFSFFIGEIIDSYNPANSSIDAEIAVRNVLWWFIGLGVGNWITSILYYGLLLSFSHRVAKRVRETYLMAILRQESAWFDQVNYTELSSRLDKETLAIKQAVGEKMGNIIYSFSMSLSGFAFAYARGWSLALAITAAGPFMAIMAG